MPRKRKTRAAPSRKAVPGIGEPNADEGKQDKADREEAIAVLKQDFQQECECCDRVVWESIDRDRIQFFCVTLCCHYPVKVREKKLEKELQDATKSLKAAHRTILISLPSVRMLHTFLARSQVAEAGAVVPNSDVM